MTHSLEIVYRVCNDNTGEAIEVGPDPDGLGLVEIRSLTDDGQVGARFCVTQDALPLLIAALQRSLTAPAATAEAAATHFVTG